MDAVSYLRNDLAYSHELLELVMQDATHEQLHWHPPGKANPLGATYAHAICSEDSVVHMVLMGKPPLFETDWLEKTGLSKPQWGAEFEWGRELKVDLATTREYAQAVYKSTTEYVSSLSEEDLDRVVDLTEQGFGKRSVALVLSQFVITHTHNMAGEASVLKGLQGAKGYPW